MADELEQGVTSTPQGEETVAPATPANESGLPTGQAEGASFKDEELEQIDSQIRFKDTPGFKALRQLAESRGAVARAAQQEAAKAKEEAVKANPFVFDAPPSSYDPKGVIAKFKETAEPYYPRFAEEVARDGAPAILEKIAANPSLIQGEFSSFGPPIAKILTAGYGRPATEIDAIMDLTSKMTLQEIAGRLTGGVSGALSNGGVIPPGSNPSPLGGQGVPPSPLDSLIDSLVDDYGVVTSKAAQIKQALATVKEAKAEVQSDPQSAALKAQLAEMQTRLEGVLSEQKKQDEAKLDSEVKGKIDSAIQQAIGKLNTPTQYKWVEDQIKNTVRLNTDPNRNPQVDALVKTVKEFLSTGAERFAGGAWDRLLAQIGLEVARASDEPLKNLPKVVEAGKPNPPAKLNLPANSGGDAVAPTPNKGRGGSSIEDILARVKAKAPGWLAERKGN